MAVNKVEVNGETVLDLSQGSVTPEQLAQGATAHNAAGEQITGTYTAPVTSVIVETGAGAVVTATTTGVTINAVSGSDGRATLKLGKPGEWSISGTRYDGAESDTITVVVPQIYSLTFGPEVSTTPKPDVSYTNGLGGLTAEEVSQFAAAISNNSDITNETSMVYIDFDTVHRKVSVGDQVTLALNDTNYTFDVIGFNHDTLTTSTAYGAATKTGKAGITFQMHDLFATTYVMNIELTNSGGWKSSAMRTSTMATMKGYLPTPWQTAIKPVNKVSGTGDGSSSGTETVSDSCFLLAEIEIFGSATNSVSGEGTQYAYYKAGNSKVKKKGGSANSYWERSPLSGYNGKFCSVTSGGYQTYSTAYSSSGVAFGFCV